MKEMIKVELKTQRQKLTRNKSEMLVVGLCEETKRLTGQIKELDTLVDGDLKQLLSLGDFKGGEGQSAMVYVDSQRGPVRILVVGLGDAKKVNATTLRKAASLAARKAVGLKIKRMSIALHEAIGSKVDPEVAGQAMAEGAYFGAYRYDEFVSGKAKRSTKLSVSIIDADASNAHKIAKGAAAGRIIGDSQNWGRTIANRPGNVINPPSLAKIAQKLARETKGLTCTVFAEKELKQKKMGGILAVGSGSGTPPRLIVLKYRGAVGKRNQPPQIGLVGKAVTFDSGGISLKPGANMDQMKLDKSGGIAVLATMKALAELKLPINVYGIIPSAENMPGTNSYRPGDIIKTASGKTVEILNTDAEGRMILCDGIDYAVKQKCEVIIDVATLTGACMVALGKYMAGLMGNDDALIKSLQNASEQSGEKVWHLPCGEEYVKEMKSKIADLRNCGSRWGGASTAAAFLSQFIGEDTKWAHLDIAGMDLFDTANSYSAEGSSGFGVRLLSAFLTEQAKK